MTEKNNVGTVQIMSAADQPPIKEMTAEERNELIGALQQEVESRNREISEKYYLVEGGAAIGERFIKFLTKEAKWKFTEAVGVIEATKEVMAATAIAKTSKDLLLQVLPLEALWFFINKMEGVGLPEAQYFVDNLLKPVAETLGQVKFDREAVNELLMRQGALEAGADFEKELNPAKAVGETQTV